MPAQLLLALESPTSGLELILAGQLAFTKVDLPKLSPMDKLVKEKQEGSVM